MTTLKKIILIAVVLWFSFPGAFGQNVGINESNPDNSALLEMTSSERGLLVPRMTTTERNAITTPANSLLIFNTTTECFEAYHLTTTSWVAFGCIGCSVPTAVTASAAPNPICDGSTLTLTGGATGATSWSWTGPNSFTSNVQSPTIASITTAGAGIYTLAAGNACGWTTGVNTASVAVSALPSTANAGTDINPACDVTIATLAANTPVIGTGNWSVISGTATITTPGSPTSGVTGLAAAGTATLRWTISNSPCAASTDDVVITTTTCFTCGGTLTISHTIGTVAPETKSVNYGTVSSTLGGTGAKCWITQNLGADNQGASATDATDAAAGWYWQFNRKQGYMVGPTPAWTITSISETSDWIAADDPCTIELGTDWRIPTYTEWLNADATGGWGNYTDTYNSVLKLHAGGYLVGGSGSLSGRGSFGTFWSSMQNNATLGRYLNCTGGSSNMPNIDKAYGHSLRCLKD
ncbi:hypothetical protein JYU20_03935 [Bacteroidales bacterium AH-315-I05]|nr:hypothetical protein [Bacteroidales bacterium AH-315-I05]